jgi:hypothetical protein
VELPHLFRNGRLFFSRKFGLSQGNACHSMSGQQRVGVSALRFRLLLLAAVVRNSADEPRERVAAPQRANEVLP